MEKKPSRSTFDSISILLRNTTIDRKSLTWIAFETNVGEMVKIEPWVTRTMKKNANENRNQMK